MSQSTVSTAASAFWVDFLEPVLSCTVYIEKQRGMLQEDGGGWHRLLTAFPCLLLVPVV